MRLPSAIERYDSGAPVSFGGLSVSQDEIAWAGGAERAAWRGIRSVRMRPYQIELNASGWKTGQVIGLAGVPDSCVAVLLIQEAAARLGVRQKGTPAAVAPPAAEHVTAAGTAGLSQADVSEVLGWPVETVAGPGTGGRVTRFRGGGADLSLTIRKRHAADWAVARLFGRAVPGIGEEARLLSRDRTLVVPAGPATVRLDLHGLPRSARARAPPVRRGLARDRRGGRPPRPRPPAGRAGRPCDRAAGPSWPAAIRAGGCLDPASADRRRPAHGATPPVTNPARAGHDTRS